MKIDLREQVAELLHDQQKGWLKWLLDRSQIRWLDEDILDEGMIKVMNSSYIALSEEEKELYRKDADNMIGLFEDNIGSENERWGEC